MVISSLVNRFLGVVLALVVLLFFGSWARAQGAAATKPEPTNLTPFIPADVCAALVLHPSRMIESPLWQLLAGQAFPLGIGVPPGVALERARQDFDPRKILRVTILSSSPPEPRAVAAAIAPPFDEAYIIQFQRPTDFAQLIPAAFQGAKPADMGGHPYYAREFAGQVQAIYPLGRTMLVIAAEPRLRKMLGENTGERPLLNQLRRAGMDHDAVFVAIVAPVLKAIEKMIGKPAANLLQGTQEMEPLTVLATESRSLILTLTVDLTRDPLAVLRITAGSEDAAKKLLGALTTGQRLFQGWYENSKQSLVVSIPVEMGKPLTELGGALLKGVQVTQDGPSAIVRLARPKDLDQFPAKLQSGMTAAFLPAPGVLTLKGHTRAVYCLVFSPDGERIASGSDGGTVKVWDAASGREMLTLKGHTSSAFGLAFSRDGKRIASGSGDNTVKVWDATSGQEMLTLRGHSSNVRSVAFSPDGKRLASGGGDFGPPGEVKVWDATSGREMLTLKGHAGRVWSVDFSPDGRQIASAGGNTVMLWDAASGQETLTLSGHAGEVLCVVFSPDGKRIASSSIVDVKVWDATSGRETVTLKGQAPGVLCVAFSADGKRIVGGSMDHAVKMWDAASGQEMPPFRGHAYRVVKMAFSPDGKRIASVSGVSRSLEVEVWDAPQGPATSR